MFLLVVRLQLKLKSHSSALPPLYIDEVIHTKQGVKVGNYQSTQQTIQFHLNEAITISKQEKYP